MDDSLNVLGAIGMGLSSAGGALNQNVYNHNVNMASQQQAQDAKKKEFLATLLTDHYQNGTLAPEAYQQAMQKLGYNIPPLAQQFDTTGSEGAIKQKLDQGGYLSGGDVADNNGGLTGQSALRSPSPLEGAAMNIAGVPSPLNQDPAMKVPPVGVSPSKPDFYSISEINSAVTDFEKSLPDNMPRAEKYKRLDAFKKDLRDLRKSQLEESTNMMKYRKEKRDSNKPITQQIPMGEETAEIQFDPEKKLEGERLPGNPDFAIISKGSRQPIAKIVMPPDHFAQLKAADTINAQLERQVDPYRQDMYAIRKMRDLLARDDGAATKQVMDELPGLFARNRTTNMLYSKNSSFGNIANRIANAVSQFSTGTFNEDSRRQLREMLDEMQKNVIRPAMVKHEKAFKERAEYGDVDPKLISIPDMPSEDESSTVDPKVQKQIDDFINSRRKK
jgi:hypothetical protein